MADRVAEIRARLVAAMLPKLWAEHDTGFQPVVVHIVTGSCAGPIREVIARCETHETALVFAAAPADLEWACGEIERLRRELGEKSSELREAKLDEWRADQDRAAAYREGAEAMREAAARECRTIAKLPNWTNLDDAVIGAACERCAAEISALPIQEPTVGGVRAMCDRALAIGRAQGLREAAGIAHERTSLHAAFGRDPHPADRNIDVREDLAIEAANIEVLITAAAERAERGGGG